MATGILQLLFDHNTSPVTSTDVTALLHPEGDGAQPVHFSKVANQRWSCNFTLIDTSLTGANRPSVGQAFRLLEDSVLLFSGFIDTIDETAIRNTRTLLYACTCSNWASLLDRSVVTKVYQQNTLASLVIADIINTTPGLAGSGITTLNVVVSGSITAPIGLEPILASQAFDTIRDMVNAQWWIDENKDLHFIAIGSGSTLGWSLSVPSDATPVEWIAGSMKIHRTSKDKRNVQYVSSSALGQPPPVNSSSSPGPAAQQYTTLTDSFVTATALDFFVLTSQPIQLDPTNPVPPTITVGGAAQTVKQYFTNASGQNAWYWTPNGIGMQQGQQIAPAPGTKVVITYQAFAGGGGTLAPSVGAGQNIPGLVTQNWVVQSDDADIATRAAFEGDAGRYENVTSVPGITDPTVAKALASGLLARSTTIPDVITYDTWRTGYAVGAKLSVVIPYHGLNATYTVIQVDGAQILGAGGKSPISAKTVLYTITLSNAQNIGDYVKWFEGLIRTIGAGAGGGGGLVPSSTSPQPGLQVIREAPSGTKNGVDSPVSGNRTFTLSFNPQPPWALWLSLNGVLQSELDGDYSLSGNTITMAVAPHSDDQLVAIYFIANPGLAPEVVQSTVYSTGPFQGDGDVDPHWILSASADAGNLGPICYVVNAASLDPTLVAAPANTRWIGIRTNGLAAAGTYTFKLSFSWPGTTGTIAGNISAADSLVLKLNGVTKLSVGFGAFTSLHAFSITSDFVAGTNDLTVDVVSDAAGGDACLLVQITQATSP